MKPPAPKSQPLTSSRLARGLWMVALYAVFLMNGGYAWADDYMVLVNEEKSYIELGKDRDWGPGDYMNAKPLISQWNESALETMLYQGAEENTDENPPKEEEGIAPPDDSKLDFNLRIHEPSKNLNAANTLPSTESRDFDNNTVAPKLLPYIPFSSSLVNLLRFSALLGNSENLPLAESEQRTDVLYPYSTVGKLFFKKSDGTSWSCSGAVIRHRLVVTAASCVHSGSGGLTGGLYKEFRFVPSYKDGSAPYGTWEASFVALRSEWINGGGVLPHPTDYAILVMKDQNGRKIWQNVGYLGWKLKTASFNTCTTHLHGIGYPASVAGVPNTTKEMRQITGCGSIHPTNPAICILGTDWGKGSGGGPWVWKFGWKVDASGNRVINKNQVVTVFSTVFADSPPGVTLKGGSVFDARWRSLYQFACANDPGNCNP